VYENRGLEKFQRDKRAKTIQKVKTAIQRLQEEGKPVNFRSVADASFITRKTLYKVPELRELIDSLRPDERQFSSEEAYEARIRTLEEENRSLRHQLERYSGLKNQLRTLRDRLKALA